MPTPRTTLWSHRHKQWLRHLEHTGAPTIRFERPPARASACSPTGAVLFP